MDNPIFLSLAGIDAINGMVIEALDGDTAKVALLNDWTKPTFDPTVPNVTYVSQAFSTSTLVGQYVGSMTFPYLKRNLNAIFPIPLVYEDPYPTTFIKLQRYFADNYDVQLDDGEFALAGTSAPLSGTDAIGITPDGTSGLVTLEALGASLRFTEGSTFSFLPTHPSVPVPLARLFTLDGDIRVATLTDRLETPPHPSDWINVFSVLQANGISTDLTTFVTDVVSKQDTLLAAFPAHTQSNVASARFNLATTGDVPITNSSSETAHYYYYGFASAEYVETLGLNNSLSVPVLGTDSFEQQQQPIILFMMDQAALFDYSPTQAFYSSVLFLLVDDPTTAPLNVDVAVTSNGVTRSMFMTNAGSLAAGSKFVGYGHNVTFTAPSQGGSSTWMNESPLFGGLTLGSACTMEITTRPWLSVTSAMSDAGIDLSGASQFEVDLTTKLTPLAQSFAPSTWEAAATSPAPIAFARMKVARGAPVTLTDSDGSDTMVLAGFSPTPQPMSYGSQNANLPAIGADVFWQQSAEVIATCVEQVMVEINSEGTAYVVQGSGTIILSFASTYSGLTTPPPHLQATLTDSQGNTISQVTFDYLLSSGDLYGYSYTVDPIAGITASTDPSTYYQSMPLFGSVAALDPSGEDYYYLTLTTIGSA